MACSGCLTSEYFQAQVQKFSDEYYIPALVSTPILKILYTAFEQCGLSCCDENGNPMDSGISSAVLALVSTTQGFLPPTMTTVQRDAISSPAQGLMLFNTTTTKLEVYDGTTWQQCW